MQWSRSRSAGFSLTELMAVVVIVGILAVTGTAYFRKHALASKVTEAQAMVQSIRAAEERYRAENRQYLNVLESDALPNCQSDQLYPVKPNGSSRPFYQPRDSTDAHNALWWTLRPTAAGNVQFGYAVKAGGAGTTAIPMPPGLNNAPTIVPTDSWYVIEAFADNDNDGVCCLVVATSMSGENYVQNEGE